MNQHWWIWGINPTDYVIQSEDTLSKWLTATAGEAGSNPTMTLTTGTSKPEDQKIKIELQWRLVKIKDVNEDTATYALESLKFPGYYLEDPATVGATTFQLK